MHEDFTPTPLSLLRQGLAPTPGARARVRAQVRARLQPRAVTLLRLLRAHIRPVSPTVARIREDVLLRTVPRHRAFFPGFLKWTAAFAVVALLIRSAPFFFLAPRTVAYSEALLHPTRGTVAMAINGVWSTVADDRALIQGVDIESRDGEATVILHDDGAVRIAPGARLALLDVSNRPEPTLSLSTIRLDRGRIWVQAFVPSPIRGIIVTTPHGDIVIQEGSVAIAVDDYGTDVVVWDRRVQVLRGQTLVLLSGERAQIVPGTALRAHPVASAADRDPWVVQNLARDAVHRREIALRQQERWRMQAGILPTSPFYQVKRVAEAMDVLLTFDAESRVQKQLAHAATRLDEAAVLLANGSTEAAAPLAEYREAILQIASGSGGDSVTQFLLRQEIAQNTAQVATVFSTDDAYLLKRVVLEATAALPDALIATDDIQNVVFLDILAALARAVDEKDIAAASAAFEELQPSLSSLAMPDALPADVRREATAQLSRFAQMLRARQDDRGDVPAALLAATASHLPASTGHATLTLTQKEAIVQGFYDRIYSYMLPRSRWNELQLSFRAIRQHYPQDAGTLLRMLYQKLPENGLARYVRAEIQALKQERAATARL